MRIVQVLILLTMLLVVSVSVFAVPGDENWEAMGGYPGANGPVYAIVQHGSDIYVGGDFTTIGGISANHIAKWDGTSWTSLAGGTNSSVYALAVDSNGILYVGGILLL